MDIIDRNKESPSKLALLGFGLTCLATITGAPLADLDSLRSGEITLPFYILDSMRIGAGINLIEFVAINSYFAYKDRHIGIRE